MAITNTTFESEKAPCGQIVGGERHRDQDEECLVTDEWFFACGCTVIRHEYHDGTFSRREVHHDGTVLVDRMNAEHNA